MRSSFLNTTRSVFDRYHVVSEGHLQEAKIKLDSKSGTIRGTIGRETKTALGQVVEKVGGADGDRTHDLLTASPFRSIDSTELKDLDSAGRRNQAQKTATDATQAQPDLPS
jgi:hypothetical protein